MNIFTKFFRSSNKNTPALKNILGFTPGNITLYELAFLHKSMAQGAKNGIKKSNERLEYLGDAVLSAVVADYVFRKFPYKEEGFLTEMRSRIVNRESLNKLALKLGLDKFSQNNTDTSKSRFLLGNTFEALVGAVYLDKGYKTTYSFITNRIMKNFMDVDELEYLERNFKSKLIEWAQKEKKTVSFELLETIPNGKNNKKMKVRVALDGNTMATAIDFSKKRAEQMAAAEVCKQLNL